MTTTAENGAAVALRPTGNIAINDGQDFWSAAQVAALRQLGVKNATNGDLAVYWHMCKRTRLDPFSRQIYMIERREKVNNQWVSKQTIQVGIDGFRVMRDRVATETGCEVEFEDTVWFDTDDNEYKVWTKAEDPAACRVVLLKHTKTRTLRYSAVLRTASYIQKKEGNPTGQWRTMADHMIEKCAEAFATRRAFPQDFSGVFIEEEMNGRDGTDQPAHRKVSPADIMQPAGDPAHSGEEDVPDAEIVDDPASDEGAKQEVPARPVTAQQVNAEFKVLGYGVKDAAEVLHIAATIAGRTEPISAVADLDQAELRQVHQRIGDCTEQADVVALMVQIADSKGAGPDSEPGND